MKSQRTELESEFDYFDAANSYPTSRFKGRNIVEIDFMYKQLLDGHKPCNTTLSLTQYHRKRLISPTSILFLSLQDYSTFSMGKRKTPFQRVVFKISRPFIFWLSC